MRPILVHGGGGPELISWPGTLTHSLGLSLARSLTHSLAHYLPPSLPLTHGE